MERKMKVPIETGLWAEPESPQEKPHLIGSRCTVCGEIYFPRKKKGWCLRCHKKTLEEVQLSNRGKIASFTIVEQAPAGGFYKGPVPYAFGFVDLTDQVRLKTLFTDDLTKLKVGQDVELVIDTLHEDEQGNEVTTFKFRPVAAD
jgi:uncharacterized OB-fold protein